MIIIEGEQRTQEWFEAKLGIPSASDFDKILKLDGSPSEQSNGYLCRLVSERATGKISKTYFSWAMQRGQMLEPEARDFYGEIRGIEVKQVCFIHNGIYGCSPDGLVGKIGLVEIKCPEEEAFVSYHLGFKDPVKQHWQQIQGQLLVTSRRWVDLFIYYPNLPPLIYKVYRDVKYCRKLHNALLKFNDRITKAMEIFEVTVW